MVTNQPGERAAFQEVRKLQVTMEALVNAWKSHRVTSHPCQRADVWLRKMEQDFIRSLLRKAPLLMPIAFVLDREDRCDGDYIRGLNIDGRQRSTAVRRFREDVFSVDGKLYSQLSDEEKLLFDATTITAVLLRHTGVVALKDMEEDAADLFVVLNQPGCKQKLGERYHAKFYRNPCIVGLVEHPAFILKPSPFKHNTHRGDAYIWVAQALHLLMTANGAIPGTKDKESRGFIEALRQGVNDDVAKKLKCILDDLISCCRENPGLYEIKMSLTDFVTYVGLHHRLSWKNATLRLGKATFMRMRDILYPRDPLLGGKSISDWTNMQAFRAIHDRACSTSGYYTARVELLEQGFGGPPFIAYLDPRRTKRGNSRGAQALSQNLNCADCGLPLGFDSVSAHKKGEPYVMGGKTADSVLLHRACSKKRDGQPFLMSSDSLMTAPSSTSLRLLPQVEPEV